VVPMAKLLADMRGSRSAPGKPEGTTA